MKSNKKSRLHNILPKFNRSSKAGLYDHVLSLPTGLHTASVEPTHRPEKAIKELSAYGDSLFRSLFEAL